MQETQKIWKNGQFVDWKDAQVHVLTHTLHYGLGCFEGIRCYRTERGPAVFRLGEHVLRLFRSAHIAGLEIPFPREAIMEGVVETVRINGLQECYIRPLVYIGYGEMGLYVRENPVEVAIAAWPWGSYLGEQGLLEGIRAQVVSIVRYHVNSSFSHAKITGYYVNSQLAKREAKANGYDEALLLDTEGYVAEGSGENIFMVRDGVIKTPPVAAILEGITRDTVLRIAGSIGVPVLEQKFTRDELYIADEVFLTGTAAEVTPVREVDRRCIGSGKPGEVTQAIQREYFRIVRGENPVYAAWLTYL